jgi:hypothetical protein
MEAKIFNMSVSHLNVSLLVAEADVQAHPPLLQLAGNSARARPLPVRTQGLYLFNFILKGVVSREENCF